MIRQCDRCGREIFFKMNKKGKWVAYTYSTNRPHAYSCQYSTEERKQYARQKIDLSTGLSRNLGD